MSSPSERRQLGCYQLLEKIGSGGMSTVYKATDTRTNAIVAVKVASRAVANDPMLSRRFELEYALTHSLSHKHLVKVIDHGKHESSPFLVMEFIDGVSLAKHIADHKRLSEKEMLAMLLPIADALTYLHGQQILHRDIKPGNILMAHNGGVKLADLGLIKNLDAMTQLTRTHTGLGTLQFAPPEQCTDASSIDPRSDIYALAVTAYAALTGEFAFGKGSIARIIERKMKNRFDAPSVKAPELRPQVDAAIRMAMHADYNKRPASVAEFVAYLTGAKTYPPGTALPGIAAARATVSLIVEPAGSNRRVKPRYAVEVAGKCQAALRAVDQSWRCTITDMSATGLCLEGDRRFEPGSTIKIAFSAADATAYSYIAWVRWCKAADGTSWQHGCQFIHALEDDDLEPVLTGLMDRTMPG